MLEYVFLTYIVYKQGFKLCPSHFINSIWFTDFNQHPWGVLCEDTLSDMST